MTPTDVFWSMPWDRASVACAFGKVGIVDPAVEIDQIAAGLVDPGPIPGLARRRILLPDIDHFASRSDLPLGAVHHDIDAIFAVQQLHVVEMIALVAAGLGKSKQLAVAIQLRFPPDRQFAFESRAVEAGGGEQGLVGDRHAAAVGTAAEQAAVMPRYVAEFEMGRIERAEQPAVGVRAIGAEADRLGLALVVGGRLRAVGQLRHFAGGVDRGAAVDLGPVRRAIGDPAADYEVERRRAPHAVGQADLRQRLQVERGILLELGRAAATLGGQLDRQFRLGFKH